MVQLAAGWPQVDTVCWPHLCIHLQDEVVCILPAAKHKVHHAVNAQLAHVLQAACAQVLAQLQSEVAGGVRLVIHDLRVAQSGGAALEISCATFALPMVLIVLKKVCRA
jgi:hypothetical protein